jgi:hypothetical protein
MPRMTKSRSLEEEDEIEKGGLERLGSVINFWNRRPVPR